MKTIINIKTEKDVKEKAMRIADELGLSLSAVVNASLKQFIRDKAVHFSAYARHAKDIEIARGNVKVKKTVSQDRLFKRLGI